jgi:hypothetical protein
MGHLQERERAIVVGNDAYFVLNKTIILEKLSQPIGFD